MGIGIPRPGLILFNFWLTISWTSLAWGQGWNSMKSGPMLDAKISIEAESSNPDELFLYEPALEHQKERFWQ